MVRIRIVLKSMYVTQKLRKKERPCLYETRRLELIHIAVKFHQEIPYSYLVMTHIRKQYNSPTDNAIT